MPSFSELVQERAQNEPSTLSATGSAPGPQSPFYAPPQAAKPQPAAMAAPAASATPPAPPKPKPQPAGAAAKRPMSRQMAEKFAATAALKEKVDPIQLNLVMALLGGQGNQDKDRSKWKIPGVGNIGVNGQKWFNLETEEGGVGAVGLVMHAKSLPYPQAVAWLGESFGENVDSDEIKASMSSIVGGRPAKTFTPPAKDDRKIAKVKHYLQFNRRIPKDIIESLVEQGRIYADEDATCVFISEGIAELRSSFDGPDAVKKLVPGSTRKKGFLVLPDPQANEMILAVCESSIDAMSYRALHPGRAAISSAGANQAFPRAIAEDALSAGFKVVAAFDADKAGDRASQALFNYFYLKLWIKHKGQSELGIEFDDDELFELLDKKKVTSHLVIPKTPGEAADDFEDEEDADAEPDHRNIFFFNKNDPFEDPLSPPTIVVTIRKNEAGLPVCVKFPIEVTKRGYDFIINRLGVVRHRPKGEKDWNELLKNKVEPSTAPSASPAP
jgi:hypothetical protein